MKPRKGKTYQCAVCNTEIYLKPYGVSKVKNPPCCSVECRSISIRKQKIQKVCDFCGIYFLVYPSTAYWSEQRGHKNTFCSRQHRQQFLTGANSPVWKGGKIDRPNGYVLNTQQGKYEHRVVVERSIGRKLKTSESVHHKNGVKTDNRIENLEILSRRDHILKHIEERRRNKKGQWEKETGSPMSKESGYEVVTGKNVFSADLPKN